MKISMNNFIPTRGLPGKNYGRSFWLIPENEEEKRFIVEIKSQIEIGRISKKSFSFSCDGSLAIEISTK
jgi:hypothetical protein